jgi:hypothetical protein
MCRIPYSALLMIALAVSGLLVGCATPATRTLDVDTTEVTREQKKQREIALEGRVQKQRRLAQLSYPLMHAAVPLCGENTLPALGAIFVTKYSFKAEFRDTAVELYGVGNDIKVAQVVTGGPADAAGIREGDYLASLGDMQAPSGKGAIRKFFKESAEIMKAGVGMPVAVMRDGVRVNLVITPVEVCSYPMAVVPGDEINAFADGNRVVVTFGMMRFAETDTELCLVVAHELAHNAMGHVRAQMQNYMLGAIFDIIAAAYGVDTQGAFGDLAVQQFSEEFEAEADYVGLYIMARAGMDIDDAAAFWRRMAVEKPEQIRDHFLATHPTSPRRFVAIEETVEEIDAKRSAGLELLPELKEGRTLPEAGEQQEYQPPDNEF